MSGGDIEFRFEHGDFILDFKGSEEFLHNHAIKLVDELIGRSRPEAVPATPIAPKPDLVADMSLSNFLRHCEATTGKRTQTMRFLITAAHLQIKGAKAITTNMVSEALQESKQKRLGNASDSLAKNIRAGYCEKNQLQRVYRH